MTREATYIWQQPSWPHMTWDEESVAHALSEANRLRDTLMGRIATFGLEERNLSAWESLTQEVMHSSQIEGEVLNRDSVRSSLAQHLGLAHEGLPAPDHYTNGVVEVTMDAVKHHDAPIDAERLFAWHAALFPEGRSGMHRIAVAQWREGDDPIQVVSGAMGHERVHYEAPPSNEVPPMMEELMAWTNCEANVDPIIKAALVHLWFVTIHPFDDGNGRLCRTLTEMMLSRADHTTQRYYSLSSEILHHRKDYYKHLEAAQKGDLDVTRWLLWFIHTLNEALQSALARTERVVIKMRFWDKHRFTPLNERQRKVLNMLLDGFDGKLTSSKWYKINHCSQDTAGRDLNDLVSKGILLRSQSGGRSTSYSLATWDELAL